MTHLLVTNDFPPKVGGIGSYLWELWRRLPADRFAVLGIAHPGVARFDASAPFRIERIDTRMLLPTHRVRTAIERLASEIDARLVVLDPALPLGHLGPSLGRPYALVVHGAEVTVPARLPGTRRALRRVVANSSLVIAAGQYPLGEIRRVMHGDLARSVVVPPGIDVARFRPLDAQERLATRTHYGLPTSGQLIISVSRLVPRKGMDVLIEASARLAREGRDVVVAIGGVGRDADRLERLAHEIEAPVRFIGRVPDSDLPALIGCGDLFAMLCRNRWGGLEQEGFGIVFLEAAATGVAQVAGLSGGVGDAVVDGVTGLLVDRPADVVAAAQVLARLLDDAALRERLADGARRRACEEFDYDRLSEVLGVTLASLGG